MEGTIWDVGVSWGWWMGWLQVVGDKVGCSFSTCHPLVQNSRVGFVVEVTGSVVRWRWCKVEVDGVNSGGSRGGVEVGGDGQRGSTTSKV